MTPSNDVKETGKTLTPFIIIFAFTILMTVIITSINSFLKQAKNNHLEMLQTAQEEPDDSPGAQMTLSPFYSELYMPDAQQRQQDRVKTDSTFVPPPPIPAKTDYKPDLLSHLYLADNALESGNPGEAENILRTLFLFYPENGEVLAALGTTLYLNKKYEEAEFIFRKQGALLPNNPIILNNIGMSAARRKDYASALRFLHSAEETGALPALVEVNLSGIYAQTGNKEKALEYFRKAYEKLGERILPLSADRDFLPIRHEKDFQNILYSIRTKNADGSKSSGNGGKEQP